MSDRSSWDPYAPSDAPATIPPKPSTLPVARLRRLGMGQRGMNVMDAWWEAMDHDTRIRTAEHLAGLTDDQLDSYVGAVDQLDKADEASVQAWVESAPAHRRQSNASLALAVESTRAEKRTALIATLTGMV